MADSNRPMNRIRRRRRAALAGLALIAAIPSIARAGDDFERYVAVSDIEGMKRHWQTLFKNKDVSFDRVTKMLKVMDPNTRLWFIGDLMRRGPYGKKTYEYVLNLMKDFPDQALGIIGNHDGNILSFITSVNTIELGINPEYDEWMKSHPELRPGRFSQMQWWSEKYGLKDKTTNWWIEIAAEKVGVDPMAPSFLRRISGADGKPSAEKLAAIVSPEEAAESFYKFCSPGGNGFEYLRRASMVRVIDSKQGVRTLLLHSGTVTKGNLGVVPGASAKTYEERPNDDWLKIWEKDLNEWKDAGLDRITDLLRRSRDGRIPLSERQALAREASTAHLIRYVDAGYDPVTRTLVYEANSVVYPEKYTQKLSAIPGTFAPEVNDLLASPNVHVDNVYGGHIPVGDIAIVRRSYSVKYGRFINAILGDTSYSPVEGNDRLVFRSDGTVRLDGQTRSGKTYATEILSQRTYAEMAKSGDEALAKRAKQIEKIGMVADGYLIVGFETTTDPATEKVTVDYDKYVLLKQDGYNFEYKHVDVWGMEEYLKTNELKYPVGDLSNAYKTAYKDKLKMLEAHKKVALTDREFIGLLEGKNVIVSSGPANASLDPVLDSVNGNPKNVQAYLDDWREYLLRLPGNEDHVLVGGGTHGLEERKNAIAAEVNKIRVSRGQKPFEIVGVITGVTGGNELDPNVGKFVVSNAFFWDDFFPELMTMLSEPRLKKLRLEFAGGGGILPNQIAHARTLKMQGMDMEIVLAQGIHARIDKKGNPGTSGTDRIINAALADSRGHSDVKIRKIEDYRTYSRALVCVPKGSPCLKILFSPRTPTCK